MNNELLRKGATAFLWGIAISFVMVTLTGIASSGLSEPSAVAFFGRAITEMTVGELCFVLLVFGLWFGK